MPTIIQRTGVRILKEGSLCLDRLMTGGYALQVGDVNIGKKGGRRSWVSDFGGNGKNRKHGSAWGKFQISGFQFSKEMPGTGQTARIENW